MKAEGSFRINWISLFVGCLRCSEALTELKQNFSSITVQLKTIKAEVTGDYYAVGAEKIAKACISGKAKDGLQYTKRDGQQTTRNCVGT